MDNFLVFFIMAVVLFALTGTAVEAFFKWLNK